MVRAIVLDTVPTVEDARGLGPSRAVLDADSMSQALIVRRREPGDRLLLPGFEGPVRLKKLLSGKRIPRKDRDRLPLVVSGESLAWVPGVGVAAPFRIRPESTRALLLESIPLALTDPTDRKHADSKEAEMTFSLGEGLSSQGSLPGKFPPTSPLSLVHQQRRRARLRSFGRRVRVLEELDC